MLIFDGFNPYNIPPSYVRYGWIMLVWAWITYQIVQTALEVLKNFKQAREYRKKIKEWEAILKDIEQMCKEREEREERDKTELDKLGFHSPVIIRYDGCSYDRISYGRRDRVEGEKE